METTIKLKGMHTDSISATVASEFSQEVGVEIGAKIEIFSARVNNSINYCKKGPY